MHVLVCLVLLVLEEVYFVALQRCEEWLHAVFLFEVALAVQRFELVVASFEALYDWGVVLRV